MDSGDTGWKRFPKLLFGLAISLCCISITNAQDDAPAEMDRSPVKGTFESIWLMDQQTVMVPIKGTFEMDFQHRFGTWDKGYDDFYGIFAPSNIRVGLEYVPVGNVMVGFGFTKQDILWDAFAKYAILRQTKAGGSPVSVTYYGNMAVDTRPEEKTPFLEATDRFSFFNALMLARKISADFSLQVSGNLSWFNFKAPVTDPEGVILGSDRNAHFSASALARYKVSNVMSVTVGYDQPITDQAYFDPEPNVNIGIEVVTSSHAFQFFIGNYQSLVPQYNHSFNGNSFGDNQILLGFNITRLWNF
jgi:hypothetical protein